MSLYRITPTYHGARVVSLRVHILGHVSGLWDIVCAGHPECILLDLHHKAQRRVAKALGNSPKLIYYHEYR